MTSKQRYGCRKTCQYNTRNVRSAKRVCTSISSSQPEPSIVIINQSMLHHGGSSSMADVRLSDAHTAHSTAEHNPHSSPRSNLLPAHAAPTPPWVGWLIPATDAVCWVGYHLDLVSWGGLAVTCTFLVSGWLAITCCCVVGWISPVPFCRCLLGWLSPAGAAQLAMAPGAT